MVLLNQNKMPVVIASDDKKNYFRKKRNAVLLKNMTIDTFVKRCVLNYHIYLILPYRV